MSLVDVVEPARWTDAQWFQAIAVATAALTLAGLLWRQVIRPGIALVRQVSDFLEDWRGTPARPGVPARPGAMARLAQLENNGGTSVKDNVDATRALVEHLHADSGALHEDNRRQWVAIRRLAGYHDDDLEEHP